LMKTRIFRSQITAMERPYYFTDEMKKGDFKEFKHEHHFKQIDNGTLMIDIVHFETPYGALGRLLNRMYLARYMQNLIEQRNAVIKEYAETNKWQQILEK
jgi:ligand-binding SRPBCC domain-containing protein